MGHEVVFISPTDFPAFFDWMPCRNEVIIYTDKPAEANSYIKKADLICCLDFNHLKRINELGVAVSESKAIKAMIDHHLDPQGFDDFRFWNPNASSTSELIFILATELELGNWLTQGVASCLYTGIMTDTGSFRFPRTTPTLHRIVADLIDAGADNVAIHSLVYDQYSLSRLHFLGYCLKDKLVVLDKFKTAYFAISREELTNYAIEPGDTEGIVNYALSITGINLAVLIIERTDRIKLSFRSKGDFPCNELAAAHFGGGGHKNASGGESTLGLTETLKKFISLLPEYQQLLVI